MPDSIYLDCQAATPLRAEVGAAMEPYLRLHFGNPASFHHLGLEAREALAAAREKVAAMIHARRAESIIFTADGTEAVNLAIKGVALARQEHGKHLIVSKIEHPAVMESAAFLERQGFSVTRLPVGPTGLIDPEQLRAAITKKTTLIAVHLANHDVGTLQDAAALAQIADERGVPIFVEAEAAAGWWPIDVEALGISLLSFSPHRFYGPRGVGVLYCARGMQLESLVHGGTQENGRRAGVENVAALVGAGVAAEIATREIPYRVDHTRTLQARIWDRVKSSIPLVKLHGPEPGPLRMPNHLNMSAEFTEGEGLVLMLDMRGIQIASGAACLGKASRVPPVLRELGVPPSLAVANIIVSPGTEVTIELADRFVESLAHCVEKLRSLSPGYAEFTAGKIESVIPR